MLTTDRHNFRRERVSGQLLQITVANGSVQTPGRPVGGEGVRDDEPRLRSSGTRAQRCSGRDAGQPCWAKERAVAEPTTVAAAGGGLPCGGIVSLRRQRWQCCDDSRRTKAAAELALNRRALPIADVRRDGPQHHHHENDTPNQLDSSPTDPDELPWKPIGSELGGLAATAILAPVRERALTAGLRQGRVRIVRCRVVRAAAHVGAAGDAGALRTLRGLLFWAAADCTNCLDLAGEGSHDGDELWQCEHMAVAREWVVQVLARFRVVKVPGLSAIACDGHERPQDIACERVLVTLVR
mmetsp:Transcript_41618/g.120695  ORF Transcript_41618/g.120695 Transcript_41618/m.120695 type:complete len:297 (+) Transcript_41618:809-1699(+)